MFLPSWKSRRWIVGMGMPILAAGTARGEDRLSFGHESYVEQDGRMEVNTETLQLYKSLAPGLDLSARGVYDGISGATPIGAPPPNQIRLHRPNSTVTIPNSRITGFNRFITADAVSSATPTSSAQTISRTGVPTAESHDIRRGYDLAAGITVGPHHFLPEFSYSKESDYVSYAGALNYALDLNNKNTTLSAGWSHAFDRVLATPFTYLRENANKSTDDFVIGVTQLLGPTTILSIDGTVSHSEGYLNDPYRGVVFEETRLDAAGVLRAYGEKRPRTRDSQSVSITLTQAVAPLKASVEGSYRFYHDSYGIQGHTAGITWFQKIGHSLVLAPSFRYYQQSAAHFYGTEFPGEPVGDLAHVPLYYSADYRLSNMETFTIGIDGVIKLREGVDLRLGYKRYIMRGLDGVTSQSAYPTADIFTVGLDFVF